MGRMRALAQCPSSGPNSRICSWSLSLKVWGESDSGGGWHSHQENSHGTHQLSWQILPTKTLTKDKPPTFLTCHSLQHQEEQSTEDGQDPHAWESPAGSQLWGEEKGGRGEWEGPFLQVRHLHGDRTEERGCDQSLLGGCTRQPRVGASWHQQQQFGLSTWHNVPWDG